MTVTRLFFVACFAAFFLFPFAMAQDGDDIPGNTGYLAIYHIDIGQGDATLIIGPTGRTLLMDAGDRGKGAASVVPLLKALGIEALDYAVASHYDADHIGGIDEVFFVLSGIPVTILDRGEVGLIDPPKSNQYKEYNAFVAAGRQPATLGNTTIDLGPGVSVLVVAANGCVLNRRLSPEKDRLDENGSSVALVINYGDFDYFVGGDLTGGGPSGSRITQDLETLAAGEIGDVDIVRLNHHGSSTSNNEVFLRTLDPEVAVISVGNGGKNKGYHHPKREVLDRLHDLNKTQNLRRIFMTNKGQTEGGLSDDDRAIMTIADGHVAVFATTTNYSINGQAFATDNRKSRAASTPAGTAQECTIDAH